MKIVHVNLLVLVHVLVLGLLSSTSSAEPFVLPGTQPGDLQIPLESADECRSCHGEYGTGQEDYEPWDSWRTSAMSVATRDPVFQAALAVAERDYADAGEYCLRCHTPVGWLAGRALPGDGSSLDPATDLDGVTCDVCHRMVAPQDETTPGNAQLFLADDARKRGKFEDVLDVGHGHVVDPFLTSAELCGTCHHVGNPARDHVLPDGTTRDEPFPLETTYLEWAASSFPEQGVGCAECHMTLAFSVPISSIEGSAIRDHDFRWHDFLGSNAWLGRAVSRAYPGLGREAAFEVHAERTRQFLRRAATLELSGVPASARAGEVVAIDVRVTNMTGHKLPTGYIDGRRMWLEVSVGDVVVLGRWDPETGELDLDPETKTWQAIHGRDGAATDHLVLQDTVLRDDRIPPEGFVATERTAPVGATFEGHWDDVELQVPVPAELAGEQVLRVRLLHQVLSREYVEVLRDEGVTPSADDEDPGERLFRIWEETGRAPPEEIASVEVGVTIEAAVEIGEIFASGSGCSVIGPTHASPTIDVVVLVLVLVEVGTRSKSRTKTKLATRTG